MPALCCLPTRTFPSYEEKKKRNPWAVSASFILVSVISECNSQQYAAYRKDQLLRGTKHHWFKTKLSFYHDFIFFNGKIEMTAHSNEKWRPRPRQPVWPSCNNHGRLAKRVCSVGTKAGTKYWNQQRYCRPWMHMSRLPEPWWEFVREASREGKT